MSPNPISPRAASIAAIAALTAALASAQQPNEDWRVRLDFPSKASALDSEGNLVLDGGGFNTVKLAPDGKVLWDRPFDIPGGHTVPSWVVVDAQDNVVRGGYQESIGGGYLAVKYDPDGNLLWYSTFGIGVGSEARRVAVDELGDVYLFGETWGGATGTEPTGHDFLTVKFSADGAFRWARIAHGTNSDEPSSLAVRGGRVVVTGHTGSRWLTVCYDYAGNELWTRLYEHGIVGGNDVVVGPAGQVVVCGWGTTDGGFPYVGTVVQYDAKGNEDWRVYHNGPFGPVDNFVRLAIADDGAVVAVGWASDAGAYEDWSVLKISPAGEELWSQHHAGIAGWMEYATAVALGPAGEVYVGGKSGPSCTGIGLEGVLRKYSADGEHLWTYHLRCGDFPLNVHVARKGVLMIGSSIQAFRVQERFAKGRR